MGQLKNNGSWFLKVNTQGGFREPDDGSIIFYFTYDTNLYIKNE